MCDDNRVEGDKNDGTNRDFLWMFLCMKKVKPKKSLNIFIYITVLESNTILTLSYNL